MAESAMDRNAIIKAAFRHQDALCTHAFAIVRDWAVAEDVVQNAFIVAMNKWEDFRPGTSVFQWVRKIVHFKAMEALRSPGRRVMPAEDELLERVTAAMQEGLGDEAAERQRLMKVALQRCMSKLGTRGVELISGFYARSESCEALAELQNRTVNAVRLSLSRLRKQLRDCMTRQLPVLEGQG